MGDFGRCCLYFAEPGKQNTDRGADTAIVVRATFPNHAFSQDEGKRLKIREILCKPR